MLGFLNTEENLFVLLIVCVFQGSLLINKQGDEIHWFQILIIEFFEV